MWPQCGPCGLARESPNSSCLLGSCARAGCYTNFLSVIPHPIHFAVLRTRQRLLSGCCETATGHLCPSLCDHSVDTYPKPFRPRKLRGEGRRAPLRQGLEQLFKFVVQPPVMSIYCSIYSLQDLCGSGLRLRGYL